MAQLKDSNNNNLEVLPNSHSSTEEQGLAGNLEYMARKATPLRYVLYDGSRRGNRDNTERVNASRNDTSMERKYRDIKFEASCIGTSLQRISDLLGLDA